MKSKILLAAIAAIGLTAVSCADLGFGVDVDSAGVHPYWYGNGYLGDTYWNTPVWNYGPVYNPLPPRPPLIGNGPGSIGTPPPQRPPQQPPRPQAPSRPPQVNVNPGNNNVPNTVGGIQRPGNGGLPNPSTIPQGRPM